MKNWLKKITKINPAAKALLLFVFSVLFLAFVFAPTPRPIDLNEVSFETTADSRIYFHNVRSFYYHIDARSKKPMRIYRLRKRTPENDSLTLQFNIVQHPSTDESFVFAQAGKSFKQYDNLSVSFSGIDGREDLENINAIDHYRIAAKVIRSFDKGESIFLLSNADTLKTLYQENQNRLNVETILEDYFRLINKR
jgi:hypothetical protein